MHGEHGLPPDDRGEEVNTPGTPEATSHQPDHSLDERSPVDAEESVALGQATEEDIRPSLPTPSPDSTEEQPSPVELDAGPNAALPEELPKELSEASLAPPDEVGGPPAARDEPGLPQQADVTVDVDLEMLGTDHPEGESVETHDAAELEEMTLPSSVPLLDPLSPGTAADPGGTIVVERLRERRGRINNYLADRTDTSGNSTVVELIEAPADHAGLQRMVEVLSQVRYSMLPELHASWEHGDRRYLAIEHLEGPTLAELLKAGMEAEQLVSIVLQLVQVLRRLHQAGWALVGLSPENILVGKPIRITQVGTATRIGEELANPLHIPGYSAPELLHRTTVTGKEDVYTLGAILYRGLSGHPVPEEGVELAGLASAVHVPGAPQVLAAALAPSDERVDLEALYHDLLSLKRRLSLAPLALRVASGTSIGLNQTRQANEDACGYLTWFSAYEGRVVYNAVLCAIDGMGGMEAGEVASTAALRAVLQRSAAHAAAQIAETPGADQDRNLDPPSPKPLHKLDPKDLVQSAAEAAFAAARGRQVGATITCAVIEDGRLTLGHVGDTRAYLLRDGVLTQLTRDHSLVAAMVASGLLSKEEARGHPESNKVLRSLGGMKTLPDEYIDGLEVAYGDQVLQLRDGDQLLLCSDGIWGILDDDALLRILSEAPDGETAVETAIRLVLDGGAPDNAAIIVASCRVIPAS